MHDVAGIISFSDSFLQSRLGFGGGGGVLRTSLGARGLIEVPPQPSALLGDDRENNDAMRLQFIRQPPLA